jgi:hypothetical protein
VPRRQRCAGWITCLTVAACSLGVPLPARSQRHTAGAPYPCQNCPCGCTDAETCWRSCCCHTNVEKLAWARRNGVKPPSFVIAAAKREQSKSRCHLACCKAKRAATLAAKSACSKCDRLAKCAAGNARCESASPACSSRAAQNPSVHKPTRAQRSSGIVLLAAKLRCNGISLSVSLLPPSIVSPPSVVTAAPAEQFQRWPGGPLLYESPYLAITPPPPDMLAV